MFVFSHELEEEYEADPNQKLITFFRFSFPQSPNEDEMLTTTSSPFDPPKFFTIIKFTFNPDTSDYDHEHSESEWGLGGDFAEDRQESSFDMTSQSGEPWKIYDSRLKYDDYDYIDSSSGMMVAHCLHRIVERQFISKWRGCHTWVPTFTAALNWVMDAILKVKFEN